MALNSLVRKKMTEFTTQRRTEIEWWDKKRAAIQADFMKELDETQNLTVRASGKSSDEDAVLVEGGGPDGQHGGLKKRKSRK